MSWLQRWAPRPSARLQLLCLPCAGGSAAFYRGWVSGLPAQVELLSAEPPGHGRRHDEPPITSMDELVNGLLAEVTPLLKRPLAVYGHSMGALVGLELARAIRRQEGRPPAALLISSSDSPLIGPATRALGGTGPMDLADEDWRRTLRELGGADEATLADRHMMDMLLAALHGDLLLLDRYQYLTDKPLGCPVRVYAGSADAGVTEEGLAAWRREGSRDFELVRMPGGHFFLRESERLFLARLSHDLAGICARRDTLRNEVLR